MTHDSHSEHDRRWSTPFEEIERAEWAALAPSTPLELGEADLERLRSAGDPIDLNEVRDVYGPLTHMLNMHVENARTLHRDTSRFFGYDTEPTPFIIGIAGSVAVGKSTTARLIRELMSRFPSTPRVDLVPTDGFLLPNAELERRGLMLRKGFPESYDRRALLRFLTEIKSGSPEVRAPFYSHRVYDIVPDADVVVRRPDVLILEGLNVLQPPAEGHSLAVSDMFDFSIYVDARDSDIESWYLNRFLAFQKSAHTDPNSFYYQFANLTHEQAVQFATQVWRDTNWTNLVENIKPTRPRARLILRKGSDHSISKVLLRKI